MYNSQKPSKDDLPSAARLLWSTAIAFVTACVILVGAVLPAEYGIDPTGLGRLLGLKDMGEIKVQLSSEAEADRQATASAVERAKAATAEPIPVPTEEDATPLQPIAKQDVVDKAPVAPAEPESKPEAKPEPKAEPEPALAWRDEVTFTLTPGEGIEIKLVMAGQAEAHYSWSTDKGVVNYDTHGDGGGREISYEKGRGVARDEGLLKAAFTGNHGWFWRNRTKEDVTVTLRTRGDYKRLKR